MDLERLVDEWEGADEAAKTLASDSGNERHTRDEAAEICKSVAAKQVDRENLLPEKDGGSLASSPVFPEHVATSAGVNCVHNLRKTSSNM